MSPEMESGRAPIFFYASLITDGTGEPKSIEALRVFRSFAGFWSHINIVSLLNLRFYTHRFRCSEQYR